MSPKHLISSIVATLLAFTAGTATAGNLDTIIGRYRTILLGSGTPDRGQVIRLMRDLSPEGTWPDVDYSEQGTAGWSTTKHLSQLKTMAAAYTAGSGDLKGNPELLDAIDRAIDHWSEKRYLNPNWWFNEIGVPRIARVAPGISLPR